jgi:hypothetical protein
MHYDSSDMQTQPLLSHSCMVHGVLPNVVKLNFQLRLRCACAAMRERCDIIAAQSQRTRIAVADQFPIATAMRRPCDVQPSMYTSCICVSNSKLLFVQTDIYVITCAAGDSVLKTMAAGLYLNGASLFSVPSNRPTQLK